MAFPGITHIHVTVYHLPSYRGCCAPYVGLPYAWRRTKQRLRLSPPSCHIAVTGLKAAISHGSEETPVQGGSYTYHTRQPTQTHTSMRASTDRPEHPLPSFPADRQMVGVTLSLWHEGAYNLRPCLHLKIHQYHIDVQYTSCQPGPSRLH